MKKNIYENPWCKPGLGVLWALLSFVAILIIFYTAKPQPAGWEVIAVVIAQSILSACLVSILISLVEKVNLLGNIDDKLGLVRSINEAGIKDIKIYGNDGEEKLHFKDLAEQGELKILTTDIEGFIKANHRSLKTFIKHNNGENLSVLTSAEEANVKANFTKYDLIANKINCFKNTIPNGYSFILGTRKGVLVVSSLNVNKDFFFYHIEFNDTGKMYKFLNEDWLHLKKTSPNSPSI